MKMQKRPVDSSQTPPSVTDRTSERGYESKTVFLTPFLQFCIKKPSVVSRKDKKKNVPQPKKRELDELFLSWLYVSQIFQREQRDAKAACVWVPVAEQEVESHRAE